jgi:Rap1a immunity proteins
MRRWLVVLGIALAGAGPAAAVSEDNFRLRTGVDLIELCGVAPGDPLEVPSIQMCQGVGVGTYQTLVAISSGERVIPFFCPPDPPISRNQAFEQFLAWAKLPENASYLNDSPAALIGRYLLTTYPCPQPAMTGAGG